MTIPQKTKKLEKCFILVLTQCALSLISASATMYCSATTKEHIQTQNALKNSFEKWLKWIEEQKNENQKIVIAEKNKKRFLQNISQIINEGKSFAMNFNFQMINNATEKAFSVEFPSFHVLQPLHVTLCSGNQNSACQAGQSQEAQFKLFFDNADKNKTLNSNNQWISGFALPRNFTTYFARDPNLKNLSSATHPYGDWYVATLAPAILLNASKGRLQTKDWHVSLIQDITPASAVGTFQAKAWREFFNILNKEIQDQGKLQPFILQNVTCKLDAKFNSHSSDGSSIYRPKTSSATNGFSASSVPRDPLTSAPQPSVTQASKVTPPPAEPTSAQNPAAMNPTPPKKRRRKNSQESDDSVFAQQTAGSEDGKTPQETPDPMPSQYIDNNQDDKDIFYDAWDGEGNPPILVTPR